jgi:hypothetical protein
MRVQVALIALSASCLLTNCATSYQPLSFTGGYSDQRLDSNTAQVSFRGNGYTAPETVHSYLLRRCAEVTLQNGYNYFVLVDAEEPNEGNTNIYGAKVNNKFRDTTTIKMFKGNKPEADVHAYDAASVIQSIPVEEGESAAAAPFVAPSTNQQVVPPSAMGIAEPTSNVANANAAVSPSTASQPAVSPNTVVNPNGPTNQPPSFEQ